MDAARAQRRSSAAARSQNAAEAFKKKVYDEFERLNTTTVGGARDTLRIAAEALEDLIADTPAEYVPVFLQALCEKDAEAPVLSRKEKVRLIGVLATAKPAYVFPDISKAVTAILERCRDQESSVREAAAEAAGAIAGVALLMAPPGTTPSAADLVVTPALTLLHDHTQPSQLAGALALEQIFPVLGLAGLESAGGAADLGVRLVKLADNELHFAPRAALIAAVAALLEARPQSLQRCPPREGEGGGGLAAAEASRAGRACDTLLRLLALSARMRDERTDVSARCTRHSAQQCGVNSLRPEHLDAILGEAPETESPSLTGSPGPQTAPLAAPFARSGHRGSGLAGALGSPEWAVRKAAADALGAAARRLGPAIDAGERRSDLIEAALHALRHDRSKPARDSVQYALATYRELARYDGPVDGGRWAIWLAQHLPPQSPPKTASAGRRSTCYSMSAISRDASSYAESVSNPGSPGGSPMRDRDRDRNSPPRRRSAAPMAGHGSPHKTRTPARVSIAAAVAEAQAEEKAPAEKAATAPPPAAPPPAAAAPAAAAGAAVPKPKLGAWPPVATNGNKAAAPAAPAAPAAGTVPEPQSPSAAAAATSSPSSSQGESASGSPPLRVLRGTVANKWPPAAQQQQDSPTQAQQPASPSKTPAVLLRLSGTAFGQTMEGGSNSPVQRSSPAAAAASSAVPPAAPAPSPAKPSALDSSAIIASPAPMRPASAGRARARRAAPRPDWDSSPIVREKHKPHMSPPPLPQEARGVSPSPGSSRQTSISAASPAPAAGSSRPGSRTGGRASPAPAASLFASPARPASARAAADRPRSASVNRVGGGFSPPLDGGSRGAAARPASAAAPPAGGAAAEETARRLENLERQQEKVLEMVSELVKSSQLQFSEVDTRMVLLEKFASTMEKTAAAAAEAAAAAKRQQEEERQQREEQRKQQEEQEQEQQRPAEVVGLPASRSPRPSTPLTSTTPRGAAAGDASGSAAGSGPGSGAGSAASLPNGNGNGHHAMPAIPASVAAPTPSPRGATTLQELRLQRKGSGTGPALDVAVVEAETRKVVEQLRASSGGASGRHQAMPPTAAAAPAAAGEEEQPAAPQPPAAAAIAVV